MKGINFVLLNTLAFTGGIIVSSIFITKSNSWVYTSPIFLTALIILIINLIKTKRSVAKINNIEKVRIEYNQNDGNFHFNDITNIKLGVGYKLVCPNVNLDDAIEFTHHLSNNFDAFNSGIKPYPTYSTVLKEFNNFVRK
jgi:hypothetical protein